MSLCTICQTDKLVLPVELACKHIFCYLCIKGVKLADIHNAKCPMCRQPLDDKLLEDMAIDDCIDKIHSVDETIKYQWLYQGRNFGWWGFDKESNKIIEEKYQAYLFQDEEDEFELDIGYLKLLINFNDMTQDNQRGKIRDIKRIDVKDIDKYNVKGISGLMSK